MADADDPRPTRIRGHALPAAHTPACSIHPRLFTTAVALVFFIQAQEGLNQFYPGRVARLDGGTSPPSRQWMWQCQMHTNGPRLLPSCFSPNRVVFTNEAIEFRHGNRSRSNARHLHDAFLLRILSVRGCLFLSHVRWVPTSHRRVRVPRLRWTLPTAPVADPVCFRIDVGLFPFHPIGSYGFDWEIDRGQTDGANRRRMGQGGYRRGRKWRAS